MLYGTYPYPLHSDDTKLSILYFKGLQAKITIKYYKDLLFIVFIHLYCQIQ